MANSEVTYFCQQCHKPIEECDCDAGYGYFEQSYPEREPGNRRRPGKPDPGYPSLEATRPAGPGESRSLQGPRRILGPRGFSGMLRQQGPRGPRDPHKPRDIAGADGTPDPAGADEAISVPGPAGVAVTGSVLPEQPARVIVDNRTDTDHAEKIAAANAGPGGRQHNRDIIKEVASINQQARDQYAYRKTTNWHQQSASTQIAGQADQPGQIIQRLNRIEEKLDALGKMLKS